jgi:hypothetical protein
LDCEFKAVLKIKCNELLLLDYRDPVLTLHFRILKEGTSWFIGTWNRCAYLAPRDSIAHNVSYHLLAQDEDPHRMLVPLQRAARLISHALKYRDEVVTGTLLPDCDPKTGVNFDNTQVGGNLSTLFFRMVLFRVYRSDFVRALRAGIAFCYGRNWAFF